MAASERAPVVDNPSPNRTMREKESTTRKPAPTGRATSSRQLFVPRSSAANWGANRCARGGEAADGPGSANRRGAPGRLASPPNDPLLLSGFSTASQPSPVDSAPML